MLVQEESFVSAAFVLPPIATENNLSFFDWLVWTVTENFGILILIAGLIGVPAGLFCGDLLRKEMGSHVDLSLINTSIGFGSVAMAGLLTVLSQTIRAGQIEPVKVLKAE